MPLTQVGQYDITITDYVGGIYAHLDEATCQSLMWEANGYGGGTIVVPLADPHLNELLDSDGNVRDGREIQVHLDATFIAALVPFPSSSPSVLTINGQGPGYHLRRRYVGRLNPSPNFVTNPTFATDLTGWTAVSGVTQTQVSTPAQVGTGAIRLVSAAPGDHYSHVSSPIVFPSLPYETFAWVTGWLYVDVGVDPADLVQGRSLFTVWSIGSTEVWKQGVRANWRNIGQWQRLKFKVYVPANNAYNLDLRLYSPVGTVYYDELSVVREERLYLSGDPGTIVCGLVAHAQSAAIGKVSANIGCDTSGGTGSAEVTRAYKYSERANIASAIDEMRSLQGGVDWTVECDGHLRNVATFDRTGIIPTDKQTLTWDVTDESASNIADWKWTWNPDYRADKVIVGGRASGDDFYEAFYDDPASELGWEIFKTATVEGSPQAQALADGYGEVYQRPLNLTVTVHRRTNYDPARLIATGSLRPCRVVRAQISEGVIQVDEDFKILKVTLNPEAETATLELVPIANVTP